MAIVSGVNIPDNKRVEISLRSIYGIGPHQAKDVCEKAGVLDNPKVMDLSDVQLTRIREIIDREKMVEGDLRREVNIDIGSYRGLRHRRNLPVRGQRTKTNARAKRSKRVAVAGRGRTTTKK